VRYGRCGTARARERDVPMRGIAGKIYGKEVIQMVRQAI